MMETVLYKTAWIPAYAGMTVEGARIHVYG